MTEPLTSSSSLKTAVSASQANSQEVRLRYDPRGGAFELFRCRAPEVCLDGPAGTGKTRAALEKIHLALLKYPGARWLVARKTNTALSASAMVTFRNLVLHPAEGVTYFGGSKVRPAAFVYPNGSELVVNGLDKPEKVKSTEFDGAYINEATECTLDDIEFVRSRLRNGKMPYQQLILDANPDAPTHWLNQRMLEGRTQRILSRHQDNPRYWNVDRQDWTDEGRAYLAILDGLTGVRRDRLRDGRWVAAEGMVYADAWSRERNVIERERVAQRNPETGQWELPREWPRYLSIDFGLNHAFVCLWWAQDTDGRLYCYREIYRTNRLVEDHAKDIKALSKWGDPKGGEPYPRAIVTDHDAEDRMTLERHLGLMTIPAHKTKRDGIQAVAARLRPQADGRPRLYYLRDMLVEVDPLLREKRQPASTLEEYESYVWKRTADGSFGEEPAKDFDHGMDATRYMVAHFDLVGGFATRGPKLF